MTVHHGIDCSPITHFLQGHLYVYSQSLKNCQSKKKELVQCLLLSKQTKILKKWPLLSRMNGTAAAECRRKKILRNRHPSASASSARKGLGRQQHLLLHFQHFPRLSFICHERLCSSPLLKVTLQITKITKSVFQFCN